uniref:Peptidase M14 domain-containing protein n=1 Tax=Desulfatirhabdium butyrativorans TaxID=340467 RepID=A0A7C4RS65_9BACT
MATSVSSNTQRRKAGRSASSVAFDLTALVDRRRIFPDANRDGYGDHVALRIFVPEEITSASIWAGVLHLAARLCFEVTSFTPPLLVNRPKPPSDGVLLSIDECSLIDCPDDPQAAVLFHEGDNHLILRSASSETLADALHALATASLREKPSRRSSERLFFFRRRSNAASNIPSSEMGYPAVSIAYRSDGRMDGSAFIESPLDAFPMKPLRTVVGSAFVNPIDLPSDIDLLDVTRDRGVFAADPRRPRFRRLVAAVRIDPEAISPELGRALADAVCRMALIATEMSMPFVFAGHAPKDRILLDIRETNEPVVEIRRISGPQDALHGIRISGRSPELAKAIREWTQLALVEDGPEAAEVHRFRNRVRQFGDLLFAGDVRGRWAHALAGFHAEEKAPLPPIAPEQKPWIEKACTAVGVPLPVVRHPKTIHRRTRWLSESYRLLSLLHSFPEGGGKLRVTAQISKPQMERKAMAQRIAYILGKLGYEADIEVLNAYKPGLSWLLDAVLPKLLPIREQVAAIRIEYRPFEPDGKALETRSRWVQELFPGPDRMAEVLDLPVERIRMVENPHLTEIYRLTAWSGDEKPLAVESFSPRTTSMPHLAAMKDGPWIHPATAGMRIEVVQPGKTIAPADQPTSGIGEAGTACRVLLDKSCPTDREWFWQVFQEEWLPLMEAEMVRRLKQEPFEEALAFWEDIRIDVAIEETDERLGIGEERICPMEALHEDIYFGLLDWFASFAVRHGLPETLQLGRIVPRVVSRIGESDPSAGLHLKPMAWPVSPDSGFDSGERFPTVDRLRFSSDHWEICWSNPPVMDAGKRSRLFRIASAWGFDADGDETCLRLRLKPPRQKADPFVNQSVRIDSPPLPSDRMLTAQEVGRWMRRLAAFPRLKVWPCGTSIQGRTIWAIEAVDAGCGSVWSAAKLGCLKPTLLFNARHHANEVSSTTAAIRMALKTAKSAWGASCLRAVNVVWIPLENPDGVATLESLLPDAPDHKLHAARYNAVGSEFYRDYFTEKPRFPEAAAKRRLWERWLPILMVDHHGFPSHEWDQPFAGIAPYRFRNFWIPITGLYLILPFLEEPEHPMHETAKRLHRLLDEAMSGESQIVEANRCFADRFRRYAYEPDPAAFDPPSDDALPAVPVESRLVETNAAVRYPEITACELIVEAADEIVSGPAFERCVRGHMRIEEALMEALSGAKS